MSDRVEEQELKSLLDALYERFHYDFRQYSQASVKRRLGQAMRTLKCATLPELQQLVLRDASVFPKLLQFMTVQVSDFFRDPSYFKLFRENIVPVLRTYPSVRLWVAGCSHGEEVYSFAILLREEGLLSRTTIYATDISNEALRQAEEGIYPLDRIKSFTVNHQASGAPCSLSEYYTAKYGSAVFDRSLRKHIVFSDHSLATDSVFAEVQVVSCRNVMIYFEPSLQHRATTLFADSLCRRGFLGLGAKETLRFSPLQSRFQLLTLGEQWYQAR